MPRKPARTAQVRELPGRQVMVITPIEDQLVQYTRNKGVEKLRITRKVLRLEAIRLHRITVDKEIKAAKLLMPRCLLNLRSSYIRNTAKPQGWLTHTLRKAPQASNCC